MNEQEHDVLRPLLRQGAFRRFYDAERGKIAGPISWRLQALDFDFDDLVLAHAEREGDRWVIGLPVIPVQAGMAALVAHELSHVVNYRTFPQAVAWEPRSRRLAKRVNELIHEPLVTRHILSYGLDPSGFCPPLEEPPRILPADPPPGTDAFVQAVFRAAYCALMGDLLGVSVDAFERWFTAACPSVAAQAFTWYRYVKAGEWWTPANARRILEHAIRSYGLTGRLALYLPEVAND